MAAKSNPNVDSDLVTIAQAELRGIGVGAVVYTLQKFGFDNCYMPIRPVTSGDSTFIGQARTLRTVPVRADLLEKRRSVPKHEDPHRVAIDQIEAGDVLVIAARGVTKAGVMGDLLAQRIYEQGGVSVVTDGAVRDMPGIDQVGLPVYASGVHAATFPKQHIAMEVNSVVGCAEVLVAPGDILVGDPEGVAVIPRQRVAEIVPAVVEQERLDGFTQEKIKEGVSLKEAYPLSDALQEEYDRRHS